MPTGEHETNMKLLIIKGTNAVLFDSKVLCKFYNIIMRHDLIEFYNLHEILLLSMTSRMAGYMIDTLFSQQLKLM